MSIWKFLIFGLVLAVIAGGLFWAMSKQSKKIEELANLKEEQIEAKKNEKDSILEQIGWF